MCVCVCVCVCVYKYIYIYILYIYIIYYTYVIYYILYKYILHYIYTLLCRGRELYRVAISWYYHESDRYNDITKYFDRNSKIRNLNDNSNQEESSKKLNDESLNTGRASDIQTKYLLRV